jgi:hypothetical protein
MYGLKLRHLPGSILFFDHSPSFAFDVRPKLFDGSQVGVHGFVVVDGH